GDVAEVCVLLDDPAPLIKVGGMPIPRDGCSQALADRLYAGERCRKAKHPEVHEELAAVHVLIVSGAANFCLQWEALLMACSPRRPGRRGCIVAASQPGVLRVGKGDDDDPGRG